MKVNLEEMHRVITDDFTQDTECELIGFMTPAQTVECNDYNEEYFEEGRDVTFYRDENGKLNFIYTELQYQLILNARNA